MDRPLAGALVMMVGLPATGKSYLARRIAERLGAELIQTDAIRRELFPIRRYTGPEHGVVYGVAHRRIANALRAGRTVVFDATNLTERQRRRVYKIAERWGARLLVVQTFAPALVVRERFVARKTGQDALDQSEATWEVYQNLPRPDPIRPPHLLVNSAGPLDQVVEIVARRVAAGG